MSLQQEGQILQSLTNVQSNSSHVRQLTEFKCLRSSRARCRAPRAPAESLLTDTQRSVRGRALRAPPGDTELFSHLKSHNIEHLPPGKVSNPHQEPRDLFPTRTHATNTELTRMVVTTIVLFSTDELSLDGS